MAGLRNVAAREAKAGREFAGFVAEVDVGAELVDGHPVGDAVGELADGVVGVVGEGMAGGDIGPAAFVLESLRKIPVEEGTEGLDAGLTKRIRQALVEVEAFGIGCAGAFREDARPRDGEAEAFDAEALHQGDVFFVAVVEVVGNVGGLALKGFAGSVGEGVPDGGAASVFVDSAFDLVAGSRGAPDEVLREAVGGGGCDGGKRLGGGLCERRQGRCGGEGGGRFQKGATLHSGLFCRHPAYQRKRLIRGFFSR